MLELCQKLYGDVKALVGQVEGSYGLLNDTLLEVFGRDGGDVYVGLKGVRKGLYESKKNLESVSFDGSLASCAKAYKLMARSLGMLEKNLPMPQDSDEIAAQIIKFHDESSEGINQRSMRKKSPLLGGLNLFFSLWHLAEWNLLSALGMFGSAMSAFTAKFFKRPYVNLAIGNLGFAASSLYFAQSGISEHIQLFGLDPETSKYLYQGGLGLAGLIALFDVGQTIKFASDRKKFNIIVNKTRGINLKQDKMMRINLALREGSSELGYVNRVCNSNGNESGYKSQINKWEEVLGRYIEGKATYQEVVDSRIKFIQPEVKMKVRPMRVVQESPKKLGKMGAEEYLKMKESEIISEQFRRRKRIRKRDRVRESDPEDVVINRETTIDFRLSPNLKRDYGGARKSIGGYDFATILDLTRQRLEAAALSRSDGNVALSLGQNNRVFLLKKGQGWETIWCNLRKRHDLSSDVNLYKIHPTGTLRGIFTVEGNVVRLLELLDHDSYKELHDRAS